VTASCGFLPFLCSLTSPETGDAFLDWWNGGWIDGMGEGSGSENRSVRKHCVKRTASEIEKETAVDHYSGRHLDDP